MNRQCVKNYPQMLLGKKVFFKSSGWTTSAIIQDVVPYLDPNMNYKKNWYGPKVQYLIEYRNGVQLKRTAFTVIDDMFGFLAKSEQSKKMIRVRTVV